jgi:hypothetical protein
MLLRSTSKQLAGLQQIHLTTKVNQSGERKAVASKVGRRTTLDRETKIEKLNEVGIRQVFNYYTQPFVDNCGAADAY